MSRRPSAGLIERFSPSRISPGHLARPLATDIARLAYRIAAELPDSVETRHALTKLLEARGAVLVAAGWKPLRFRYALDTPPPAPPDTEGHAQLGPAQSAAFTRIPGAPRRRRAS